MLHTGSGGSGQRIGYDVHTVFENRCLHMRIRGEFIGAVESVSDLLKTVAGRVQMPRSLDFFLFLSHYLVVVTAEILGKAKVH